MGQKRNVRVEVATKLTQNDRVKVKGLGDRILMKSEKVQGNPNLLRLTFGKTGTETRNPSLVVAVDRVFEKGGRGEGMAAQE